MRDPTASPAKAVRKAVKRDALNEPASVPRP